MKWLRLVGSPKILVSFAKEPHKRDIFSAKETYIFKEPSIHSHLIYIYSNMLRWYVFYVCIIVHAFDPVSQAPFAKLSAMYIFATFSAIYIRDSSVAIYIWQSMCPIKEAILWVSHVTHVLTWHGSWIHMDVYIWQSMCRTDYPVVMYIFATSSAIYIRSRLPHPLLYIYGIPLWLYTYS